MSAVVKKYKIGLSQEDIENIKKELGQIEVDKSMSDTSENPVGNKYIKITINATSDITVIVILNNLLFLFILFLLFLYKLLDFLVLMLDFWG